MLKRIKHKLAHTKTAFDEGVISWIAPEYIKYERGLLWKIVVVLAMVAIVGFGVYYREWTFPLAVLTFVLVYVLIHRENPKDVKVIISKIGVKVGGRQYPFTRIKAFWLNYIPPHTKILNLRVSGDLALDIPIQLKNQDPAQVRDFLIEKIPEKEGHKESLSDIFTRLFKI